MNNIKNMSSTTTNNYGYLELIIGPMFSGKTSRLVEIYNQCKFCNIKVIAINHSIDNRYDDDLLSTHDKIKIPCIKTERLFDVWSDNVSLEENIEKIPRISDKLNVFNSLQAFLIVTISACAVGSFVNVTMLWPQDISLKLLSVITQPKGPPLISILAEANSQALFNISFSIINII